MNNEMDFTPEYLCDLFSYRNGKLYWRKDVDSRHKTQGKLAGTLHHSGYLQTHVKGKLYFNHRLIFMMHYGYMPKSVDHRDGNRQHNDIENLRATDSSGNNCNRRLSTNSSGIKGVSWNNRLKKWVAQIKYKKKHYYLGIYSDLAKAVSVVREMRLTLHGEFANHG